MMKRKIALGWMGILILAGVHEGQAMGKKPPTPHPGQGAVHLGEVAVSGTGCPAGSALTEVAADGKQVRIRLTGFSTQSAGRLDRKACSVAIPVTAVPAGTRLVVAETTLFGTFEFAPGASGNVSVETFSAEASGGDKAQKALSASDSGGTGSIELSQSEIPVTACSASGMIRLNASAWLKSQDASSIHLDTAQLVLRLEKCE